MSSVLCTDADVLKAREMIDAVSDDLKRRHLLPFRGASMEEYVRSYQRHVFPRAGKVDGTIRVDTFEALATDYTILLLERILRP